MYSSGGQAGAYSSGRARAVKRCAGVNSGLYNDNMTKTYEINVPSGKYSIDQSDDLIYNIYHAFEYLYERVITNVDRQFINDIDLDVFDVFEIITIIVNE